MLFTTPDFVGFEGRTRIMQATWDAMVTSDPADLSFSDIARVGGFSHSLINRHFKTRGALFGEVAACGFSVLHNCLADAKDCDELVFGWMEFALARPRHYHLMFAPDCAEVHAVASRRDALVTVVREMFALRIGRPVTEPQALAITAIIHGSAVLLCSGVERPFVRTTLKAIDALLGPPA